MKTIIVLGSIMTIILVVKLEAIRPYSDRVQELSRLTDLRNRVIDEYLPNYDRKTALEILSQYILNEIEMFGFAEYLNRTGNIPESSRFRKLKNYRLYEHLRFTRYMEATTLSKIDGKRIINTVKSAFLENTPELEHPRFFEFYKRNNLNELMLFTEYIAIRGFLNSAFNLELNDPVSNIIRRGLYNLAIRQYDPNSFFHKPKDCYLSVMQLKSFSDNIRKGDKLKIPTFTICISTNKLYSLSSANTISNSSYNWVRLKFSIIDPIFLISLKDIMEDKNEELYLILPTVLFTIQRNPVSILIDDNPILLVDMVTVPFLDRSSWFTALANEIGNYIHIQNDYL